MHSDTYAASFYGSPNAQAEYQLVVLLVKTALVGNFTGPGTNHSYLPGSTVKVTGILNPGLYNGAPVNLRPYFDGTLVSSTSGTGNATLPVATNWLDGGGLDAIKASPLSDPTAPATSNQQRLLNHLYSFFGGLLVCSFYGSGPAFPAYAGDPSMYNAHKYMDLGPAEMGYFIQELGLAAESFGVPDNAISAAAALVLQSVFGRRCAPPEKAYSLPNSSVELQAICTNPQCPLAANATCQSYANVSAPATVAPSATPTPTARSGAQRVAAGAAWARLAGAFAGGVMML